MNSYNTADRTENEDEDLGSSEGLSEEQSVYEISDEDMFAHDLESVKAKYPFISQSHVSQFGSDFIELMAEGKTDAVKAFEITHTDEIIEHRTREAVRRAYGKAHMKRIDGGANMQPEVPADIYRQYKRLIPDITDEEIRRHYASSLND